MEQALTDYFAMAIRLEDQVDALKLEVAWLKDQLYGDPAEALRVTIQLTYGELTPMEQDVLRVLYEARSWVTYEQLNEAIPRRKKPDFNRPNTGAPKAHRLTIIACNIARYHPGLIAKRFPQGRGQYQGLQLTTACRKTIDQAYEHVRP
jgi:hypothetical protein